MGSSSSKPARKLGQQASSQALRQGTPSRPIPNATNDSSRFREGVAPSPGLGSVSGASESKTEGEYTSLEIRPVLTF